MAVPVNPSATFPNWSFARISRLNPMPAVCPAIGGISKELSGAPLTKNGVLVPEMEG